MAARSTLLASLLCVALLPAGCRTLPPARMAPAPARPAAESTGTPARDHDAAAPPQAPAEPAPAVELTPQGDPSPYVVTRVSFAHPPLQEGPELLSPPQPSQPGDQDETITAEEVPRPEETALSLPWLVDAVLARNPSLQAAVAAWRAAAERYPQAISLEDPMFGAMLGPASIGSDEVDTAYMLELSQEVPWPGKRRLRGKVAQEQARAVYHEVGEARLQIAETAKVAFFDYWLAAQELALNEANLRLMEEFREIALVRYEARTGPQQDVLLADVELGELRRRELELRRMLRVAAARINTLLREPADAPLAPPPEEIPPVDLLPPADLLRHLAVSARPELAAQAARIRSERAELALAWKEFYPDFEFIARYDAFWQEEPLRPMIGMNLNLPLQHEKRRAAVREATNRLIQEQAEFENRLLNLEFDVQQSYERVAESRTTVELYRETILPAAETSVESARAGYVAQQIGFLQLIDAQRQRIAIEERLEETIAEYHRRLAALERVVGAPVAPPGH